MAKTFPYIEVSGSHQNIGHAIGESLRQIIRNQIEKRQQTLENYSSYIEKIPPFYRAAKNAFPQLIEELEAIAQAARVQVNDYFLFNCREIYDVSLAWDLQDQAKSDHCTIAVSFNKNGAIVGHNEDWSIKEIDELYVLKATTADTTFLGLNYAINLPGDSAAMNNWGLVQCINDLHSDPQIGVPKNFLARAVLECKNLNEAEVLIKNTNRASGYNHVLVQDNQVRNIEIANHSLAVEQKTNQPYVHTNHYLSKELQPLEKFRTNSSEQRYQRAKQLVRNNMTKEEMIALLSDKTNPKYPICRATATIGSVVLLPKQKEVWICYDHPCAGEFVRYTL